ncbi:MAG: class I SAM-dependent methyltransferase [candidate division NC10 bacterium]|nr:class I SAM-dependent methyltransferase [candidate division NC10 bacterium]
MDPSGGYAEHTFVAEFYDYVVPYRERQDVPFFVEMAGQAGSPVLELGCGTGRVLIPIARAGVEIVGLDFSPAMLAVCREKLSRETADVQARVQLVHADMRKFALGQEFRLVTIPFRSFQHLLTVEEQLSCLSSIHTHLVPGGRLVLDVFNPSLPRLVDDRYLVEAEQEPAFTMPDSRRVVRQSRLVSRDLARQILEVEFTYTVTTTEGGEERLTYRAPIRYLFRFEAEHLLARSGFTVEVIWADYDRSPYGTKDPGELIFIARRV